MEHVIYEALLQLKLTINYPLEFLQTGNKSIALVNHTRQ